MPKYKNEQLLKEIGERVKDQRIKSELEIEDISEMTGFTSNTIRNLEDGNELTLSYFVEICKAIKIHPKEILDLKIDTQTRFKLSPSRKEKPRLTARVKLYLADNYFLKDRTALDILQELEEAYQVKSSTAAISVILNRMVKMDILKASKKKNIHYYSTRKKES
jgi:transcriptional regulator with XRE-family HTH domain